MVDISQLGASGAVVIVVGIFLKFIRDENAKRDARDALLVKAINNIGKESKLTRAVAKSADEYLRERNGRDAKSHTELMVAVEAIPTKMQSIADTQAETLVENLKKLPAQNIEHQHVREQKVENVA